MLGAGGPARAVVAGTADPLVASEFHWVVGCTYAGMHVRDTHPQPDRGQHVSTRRRAAARRWASRRRSRAPQARHCVRLRHDAASAGPPKLCPAFAIAGPSLESIAGADAGIAGKPIWPIRKVSEMALLTGGAGSIDSVDLPCDFHVPSLRMRPIAGNS
jgi:hypothetical protein